MELTAGIEISEERLLGALHYLGRQGGTIHQVLREVKTSHVYPPIPIRTMDWSAWFDGREEGCVAHGRTEEDAVNNLLELVEEYA